MDRRERATDRDRDLVLAAGEVELLEAHEAAHQRRVLAVAGTETERGSGVGDGELDARRIDLEAVGQMAQEQQRGRPERGQPERLGVPTSGVVPDDIEHGVGPGRHSDCDRHRVNLRSRQVV